MANMAGPDGPAMGDLARFNGRATWYPKDDFDAAGYAIPTTWNELIALAIVSDAPGALGSVPPPWRAAHGEFTLRTTTPETNDKWVSGELNFDSP